MVSLAILEGGNRKTKRGLVVQVAPKGSTTFRYQVKPKVGGEKAEVYKDDDWFEEDNLVGVPKK